ncbi:HYR-like domain-containing protein, partial [Tenacibaculum caenipelagi]
MKENYVLINSVSTLKSIKCFRNFLRLVVLLMFIGYSTNSVYGQDCGYSNGNPSSEPTVTPTTTPQLTSTNIGVGEYFFMNVQSGGEYTISTCDEAGFDTVLSVYNNTDTSYIIGNDDFCGYQSEVTFVADFTGQVKILLTRYTNGNGKGACTFNGDQETKVEYSGSLSDSDGDGIDDSSDVCNGFDDTLDNDGDLVPDGCDLDDDNDGILDVNELGTCTTNNSTLNWDNEYVEGGSGDATLGEDPVQANPNLTVNGTVIKLRRDGGGLSTQEYRINDFNTTNSSYTLYQKAENNGESRHVFEFSEPVYNLGFTIYDVDEGGGNTTFIDEIELILTKADGTTHTLSSSEYTLDGQTFTSNTFKGEASSTDRDVVINGVQAWIIKMELVYRNLTTSPSSAQYQGTGLSNFTFCNSQRDTDSDGTPDYLDTDSDGDGCFDAIEGDENVEISDLSSGSISGGVDSNGVPNLVNSGGTADGTNNTQGQGIGTSATFNSDAVPSLTITDPDATCASFTVDLTAVSITSGSTSGTLTYWTDANATNTLASPEAVSSSGTYYIKLTSTSGCFEIEPVTVTINALPTAATVNSNSLICSGEDAVFTISGDAGNIVTYSINGLSSTTTIIGADGTVDVRVSGVTADTTIDLTNVSDGTCDRSLSVSETVIVDDTTAPVADVATLSDVTGQCEVTSLSAPTATDNCSGSVTGTHNASLPITTQGTTVVTWTYEDAQGNTSTQTQNVVIDDTTAPVADVATLSDVTGQCEVTSLSAPTATDNCSGSVTGTHNASLPITTQGTTVVTWTYEDAQGNTSTQTQNVVIDDTTA